MSRFEVYELPGDDDTTDVYCRDTLTGEVWSSRKHHRWQTFMRQWIEKQVQKTKVAA